MERWSIMLKEYYDEATKKSMVDFHQTLSEKDRQRYAAVEEKKIRHGGILYMAMLFGCDEKTIQRGIKELSDDQLLQRESQRKTGGGRKFIEDKHPGVDGVFLDILRLDILRDHTAGSPMDATLKWTNLSKLEIKAKLSKRGIKVSSKTIGELLKVFQRNGLCQLGIREK